MGNCIGLVSEICDFFVDLCNHVSVLFCTMLLCFLNVSCVHVGSPYLFKANDFTIQLV